MSSTQTTPRAGIALESGEQERAKPQLARRSFLALAGPGAAVVALGGLIRRLERDDFRLSRPPGAVIEEEFLSLCIRCGKCAEACPWHLISPIPITESLVSAGTPRLEGHCRRCWLCIPVCPTGALR